MDDQSKHNGDGPVSEASINCGRCAHLWGRKNGHPDSGVCACHARQVRTGQLRPTVSLDATCEDAQLSAKFDPDFWPRVIAARQGKWDQPPLEAYAKPATPVLSNPPPPPQPPSSNESPSEFLF